MTEQYRIQEHAEKLRQDGLFLYFVLIKVARRLHGELSQRQAQTPIFTPTPDLIAILEKQFKSYFTEDFRKKWSALFVTYLDRWIEENKPIIGRWAIGIYPSEYESDEGWQKFCSDPGLAEQYVIDFVAIQAANEILQAVNFDELTVATLESWLGLGKVEDAAFAQAIHKLSKLQQQILLRLLEETEKTQTSMVAKVRWSPEQWFPQTEKPDTTAFSRSLKRLEERGLIVRYLVKTSGLKKTKVSPKGGSTNKRTTHVKLTPLGAAILIMEFQLVLGEGSNSNPWIMKVSRCSQLSKHR